MKMYRTARPAPTVWHVVTTALQMSVFWSTFLLVLPHYLHRLGTALGEPALGAPWPTALGPAVFTAASALGLWSAWTMAVHGQGTPLPLATARRFVVCGPYRHVRNPMAIAGITQGIAVGVWRDSPTVLGYALAGAVLWHCIARPSEERDLLARFGADFEAYRARVPLWLPQPRRGAADGALALALAAGASALAAAALAPPHRAAAVPAAGLLLLAAFVSRRPAPPAAR